MGLLVVRSRRDTRSLGLFAALASVVAAIIGMIGWQLAGRGDPWSGKGGGAVLPERMETEEVIANLSATFDRSAIIAEAPEAPVHVEPLQPGFI
jgi:hypothetical protein